MSEPPRLFADQRRRRVIRARCVACGVVTVLRAAWLRCDDCLEVARRAEIEATKA